ncbi:MAG TPA: adenosine kinase [Gammaproteobacteria bacterium]|jgi:sugar/nucleoside kinase (ribokinase family)|nr:adenosine kinase [Gammaproteobacteria bacterium]
MAKYNIYGIGAAIVDTEVIVSDSFLNENKISKGLMTLVDEKRQKFLIDSLTTQRIPVKRSCGGSACNSVVAASRFGSSAFFSGKVANDEEGVFFVKDLKRAGVDFHQLDPSNGVTGKCLVMVTPDAERTMNTNLGASLELSYREIDEPALANSDWLYIEGYVVTDDKRTAVARDAMTYAKQSGVKTSLSLSDPFVVEVFSDNIKTIIGEDGIDLIFCNGDEARSFTGTHTIEAAAESLKQYAKTFAITRGPDGSLTYDGQDISYNKAVQTNAIDTNGAGDMFAGAFLHALISGREYSWAAQFANTASSIVVSSFGPRIKDIEYISLKSRFGLQ